MNVNKKISKKREQKIAIDIKGKAHPGSGAVWYKKGDVSNKVFQIEDKFTRNDAYSLSIDTLKKIELQSKKIAKIPILSIGYIAVQRNYAILRKQDFQLENVCRKEYEGNKSTLLVEEDMWVYFLRRYAEDKNTVSTIFLTLADKEYYIIEWGIFIKNANRIII